jgi:hemerythrin-like domain-containing protein
MKITQALLAEHVVFHSLFDYIERTLPKLETQAEVKALAALLEFMLRGHGAVEDELIMAPLEPVFQQIGQQENFHEEHEEIDGALATVQEARTAVQARKLLLKAVVQSRKHFDKEERIVFPLAEKQLSARSLELLGKKWEHERKVIAG